MKYSAAAFVVAAVTAAGIAHAQHHRPDSKALSEQEIEQYRAGAGMGYARAAELNHFPGPMHVLELSDKLSLSIEQRSATQRLMDGHKAEARAIGAKLVEAERSLEALFKSGRVDPGALADATHAAARLQGEYRLSHLETHRRMRALLSDEQVARYNELRGYANLGASKGDHRRH